MSNLRCHTLGFDLKDGALSGGVGGGCEHLISPSPGAEKSGRMLMALCRLSLTHLAHRTNKRRRKEIGFHKNGPQFILTPALISFYLEVLLRMAL